jgi:serine/threonine protein kinase
MTQFGRFRILGELGEGATGYVLLAEDPQRNRKVALKIPRAEVLLSVSSRRRFLNEGATAAALHHPNLVPVLKSGEVDSVCYVVSEYLPGPTLAAWLAERKHPVPPASAARIIAALAGAVDYMHRQGIIHRDIKPSNVLLKSLVIGHSSLVISHQSLVIGRQ